jgi:hypothetical protein
MERATLEKLALKKCSAQNYHRLKECIDSISAYYAICDR